MRTSAPGIFACGDCVESISALGGEPGLNLLWPNAAHQGAVAGANAAGDGRQYIGDLFQMVIELPGLVVGAVGATEQLDDRKLRILDGGVSGGYHVLIFDEGDVLIGAQSVNNLRYLGLLQNVIRQQMCWDDLRAPAQLNMRMQQFVLWMRSVARLTEYIV
jgi:NADPH-dependent 2,4-dienoyl-CoA reductase/sulfur reductase-like enzyme